MIWAIPLVQLALPRRNSGKMPDRPWACDPDCLVRKKTPKENLHKEFRRGGGGQGGGLGAQILYVGVGFPSRIQHKEFRGGGSKGFLGGGSKVKFWGPISLCLCAFWGLDDCLVQPPNSQIALNRS